MEEKSLILPTGAAPWALAKGGAVGTRALVLRLGFLVRAERLLLRQRPPRTKQNELILYNSRLCYQNMEVPASQL